MAEPNLPDVDADQYAALVAGASDEELAKGMAENRELVLTQVFERMPERFNAQKAGDRNVVVEWRIRDRPGGGDDRWQLVIENGTCKTVRDGDAEPNVTFSVGAVDFIKVITGNASGPMLFTTGQLQIGGDLMLAALVQGFFDMPAGAS